MNNARNLKGKKENAHRYAKKLEPKPPEEELIKCCRDDVSDERMTKRDARQYRDKKCQEKGLKCCALVD